MSGRDVTDGRGGGWVAAQVLLVAAYLGAFPYRALARSARGASGLVLLAAGCVLCLAGLVRLGRGLTPFPAPADKARLATDGVYGLVRHPIYSGLSAASFGWAIATGDAPRLFLAAALLLFFDAKARFEERLLTKRFPEYAAYALRVRRLIPWIY